MASKPNPRRRRARQKYLAHGPKNRPMQIFSNEAEHGDDISLVIRCLQMAGYKIPQRAYELAVEVPMKLAEDEKQDSRIHLRAANLIRMVVKDAKEIEMLEAELAVLKKDSKNEVFVREDEDFFGNEAHEKAKRESQGSDPGGVETAGDRSTEGPPAPTGDAEGQPPA